MSFPARSKGSAVDEQNQVTGVAGVFAWVAAVTVVEVSLGEVQDTT